MKTQANKKLFFKKSEIIELSDASLSTINAGTGTTEIQSNTSTGGGTVDDPNLSVVDRPKTKPFCTHVDGIAKQY